MQKFCLSASWILSNFLIRRKINKIKTIEFDRLTDALSSDIKMMNFHYSTCAQQTVQNDQK